MEANTIKNARVKEFEKCIISKCDITIEYNRHAVACLTFVSDSAMSINEIESAIDSGSITLINDNKKMIFVGKIATANILNKGTAYTIEVVAHSNSIVLDTEKRKRSFQNVSMTYRELAERVLGSTKNAMAICSKDCDVLLDRIFIQYNETDWQFLKRVFSKLGLSIRCDVTTSDIIVYIGNDKELSDIKIVETEYTQGIVHSYHKYGKNSGLLKNEYVYYDIKIFENYEIGIQTIFHGEKLRIFSKHICLENGMYHIKYRLGANGLFVMPPIYNNELAGISFVGKVIKTENETVKVHLDMDVEQNENEAFPFEWTPLSGNMMYCMPMNRTRIAIYFSDREETSAKAIACVGEEQESISCGKGASYRAFATEHNKKMELEEDGIIFTSNRENTIMNELSLKDSFGILFSSKNDIICTAIKEIEVESDVLLDIEAVTEVQLIQTGDVVSEESVQNPQADVELAGDTNGFGDNFLIEAHAKVPCKPFEDAPEEGEFEWGELWKNVAIGMAVAVAVAAAVAAVAASVLTLGAATVVTVFVCGVIGGAVAVGFLAKADYDSGNVSETGRYALKGGIYALTGSLSALWGPSVATGHLGKYLLGCFWQGTWSAALGNGLDQISAFLIWGDELDPIEFVVNVIMSGGTNTLFGLFSYGIRMLLGSSYKGPIASVLKNKLNNGLNQRIDAVNKAIDAYNEATKGNVAHYGYAGGPGNAYRKAAFKWLSEHRWELFSSENVKKMALLEIIESAISGVSGEAASNEVDDEAHAWFKKLFGDKDSSLYIVQKYIQQYGY